MNSGRWKTRGLALFLVCALSLSMSPVAFAVDDSLEKNGALSFLVVTRPVIPTRTVEWRR